MANHLLIMMVLILLLLLLLLRSAAQHALQHLNQRLLPVIRRARAGDRRQRPRQSRLRVCMVRVSSLCFAAVQGAETASKVMQMQR